MNIQAIQRKYNLKRILANVLVICVAGFYCGYVISYFQIIPISEIHKQFKVSISLSTFQGFFSGIIYIGIAAGACLMSFIQKILSRRNSLLLACVISLIGSSIILITNFTALLIGRIIQGICLGFYTTICPYFIKQLVPLQLGGYMLALFKIIGLVSTISTNIISIFTNNNQTNTITSSWRIIFSIPLIFPVIQIVLLVFVYPNETPKYLEAKELVSELYRPEYVQEVLSQKMNDIATNEQIVIQKSNRKAILIAFHISILQAMVGEEIVIQYGRQTLNDIFIDKGGIFETFLNTAQIGGWIIYLVWMLKRFGRKGVIQIGTFLAFSCLFVIGTAYLPRLFQADKQFSQTQRVLIPMFLFIFTFQFGGTLGVVFLLYISEIVQPKFVSLSVMFNCLAKSLLIILFPILQKKIGSAPLFYFLSVWCFISLFINAKYLMETQDKTETEISELYRSASQQSEEHLLAG